MIRRTFASAAFLALLIAASGWPAAAQAPNAASFLAEQGFSQDQIAQVEAGNFVTASIQPSGEREIAAAFAFMVPASPTELVNQLGKGLVDQTDSNTLAFEIVSGPPSVATFSKLTLQPDAQSRAQAYRNAAPGTDLNLSNEEIAAFQKLGSGAPTAAVEQAVRSALLARLKAYQASGLAGAAPYARASGGPRSPADELRTATKASSKRIQEAAPNAYQLLLNYPASKPPGTREAYRWAHYIAHGTPTIALMHSLYVPEGDAWLVAQRQFYVSGGYNAEQAIAGLFPIQKGTLVFYTNRTSTDQVEGFGGGAKRSIGSRLLASELEALYKKIQAAE